MINNLKVSVACIYADIDLSPQDYAANAECQGLSATQYYIFVGSFYWIFTLDEILY